MSNEHAKHKGLSSKRKHESRHPAKPLPIRPNVVRVSDEAARCLRDGHPWIYENALMGRRLNASVGDMLDIIDRKGDFLGRAVADPSANIPLRLFSTTKNAKLDAESIQRTVHRAATWRRQTIDCGPLACHRIISGDSEGLPGVHVDRYGGYLVVLAYSPIAEVYLNALVDALVASWQPKAIYRQKRFTPANSGAASRSGGDLLYGKAAPPEVLIEEHGMRFWIEPSAPLSTGFFADMRLGRRSVQNVAAGRRVLNCFSHTGSFSVAAALSGAASVVSVDSAERMHARAKKNFRENKLADNDRAYEFLTADALAALARFASRERQFDLIILDPPSFAHGRGQSFAVSRDYVELVGLAQQVLSPGGLLYVATNSMKITPEDLERSISRAANAAKREAMISERIEQPADYAVSAGFPQGRYLKCFQVRFI